jgi:phage regulator Rha-like protein
MLLTITKLAFLILYMAMNDSAFKPHFEERWKHLSKDLQQITRFEIY